MFKSYKSANYTSTFRAEDPDSRSLAHNTTFIQHLEFNKEKTDSSTLIVGYADDRGVARNYGRRGAAEGPEHFRKHFYRLASISSSAQIFDRGDLQSSSLSLEDAHQRAAQYLKSVRSQFSKVITIGGGHDWAWADYQDLASDPINLIINIDAHLDMRPNAKIENRRNHSGCPFRLLLEQNPDANILVMGLQKHCNQQAHINWANEHKNVAIVYLEDLQSGNQDSFELIDSKVNAAKSISLSLDLDVFPQSICPGVSAPQSMGISPNFVQGFMNANQDKINHLGVYELNPKYDRDDQSARLAATIVHQFLS